MDNGLEHGNEGGPLMLHTKPTVAASPATAANSAEGVAVLANTLNVGASGTSGPPLLLAVPLEPPELPVEDDEDPPVEPDDAPEDPEPEAPEEEDDAADDDEDEEAPPEEEEDDVVPDEGDPEDVLDAVPVEPLLLALVELEDPPLPELPRAPAAHAPSWQCRPSLHSASDAQDAAGASGMHASAHTPTSNAEDQIHRLPPMGSPLVLPMPGSLPHASRFWGRSMAPRPACCCGAPSP